MHLRRPWHRMLLLPSLGLALLAQGARAQASASLRLDNDYFNFWQAPYQRPDVEYTQGADLSVRWPATTAWLRHLTPVPTPCADSVPPEVPCGLRIVSLGQDMYTPSIDSPRLLPGQRPYAGWLYLSFAERVESRSRVRGVALTLGITGRPSLAESFQDSWHEWFGFRKPLGWAGQLPFEPTLGLRFHLAQVIWGAPGPSPVAKLAASGTLQLGTPLTDVEAGLRATMGWHAPPPWERTAHRATARPLGVYAIGAVRGDLVGYDEFLDGTVFRGSPSVARRWVVGQAEVGVGVAIHRVHIEWTVIHRARAYSTQPDPHTYSRLDFGWD